MMCDVMPTISEDGVDPPQVISSTFLFPHLLYSSLGDFLRLKSLFEPALLTTCATYSAITELMNSAVGAFHKFKNFYLFRSRIGTALMAC